MRLVDLLDLHRRFALEQVPRFFEDDLCVLCEGNFMAQVLDDSENKIVDFQRCTLPIVDEGQYVIVDYFKLLKEALHHQVLLFFVDILVKKLVIDEQDSMLSPFYESELLFFVPFEEAGRIKVFLVVGLPLSGRFLQLVVVLLLLEKELGLRLVKKGLLWFFFLDLFVQFILLIKQLHTQVIALAIFSDRHLYLLLHHTVNHNCCCLPRTFTVGSHCLYCSQLLPIDLQLLLRSQFSMFVAEFADECVVSSILIEFPAIPGVRLILFGYYFEFLLQVRSKAKALRAKCLSANIVNDLRTAIGTVIVLVGILVDHREYLTIIKVKSASGEIVYNQCFYILLSSIQLSLESKGGRRSYCFTQNKLLIQA